MNEHQVNVVVWKTAKKTFGKYVYSTGLQFSHLLPLFSIWEVHRLIYNVNYSD